MPLPSCVFGALGAGQAAVSAFAPLSGGPSPGLFCAECLESWQRPRLQSPPSPLCQAARGEPRASEDPITGGESAALVWGPRTQSVVCCHFCRQFSDRWASQCGNNFQSLCQPLSLSTGRDAKGQHGPDLWVWAREGVRLEGTDSSTVSSFSQPQYKQKIS